MSILLDTQALLWYVLDEPHLSRRAHEAIAKEPNDVYVSPASLWEVAIKISIGKYKLAEPFQPYWERVIRESEFTMLPLTVRHINGVIELPLLHRDPFDRMLVAQSLAEKIALVSSDNLLDAYGIQRIW